MPGEPNARLRAWLRSSGMTPAHESPSASPTNAARRHARRPAGTTRSGDRETRGRPRVAGGAASGSGCRRSGSRRGRAARDHSVLEEVLLELESVVLVGVGVRFGPPDLQVFGRQWRSQRPDEHLVLLELVERLTRLLRKAADTALLALGIRQVAGILVERLAGIELALDAVERGGDEATKGDVRIGARVARLELQVRRAILVVPVAAGDADGGLAILEAPRGVRGAPVVRLEAAERVDAGGRQREQCRQVREDAGDRIVSQRAEAIGRAGIRQPVGSVVPVPDAPVEMG